MTLNIETVYAIPGFLDTAEAYLLHNLAKSQEQATVVEIGTFYGRATYCLATGAQASGGHVYTIDPYAPYTVGEMTVTPRIAQAVGEMLKKHGLAECVTPIIDSGVNVAQAWDTESTPGAGKPVDVLFIDGSHEYRDVKADFRAWQKHVRGVIAFHDASGNWPGVSRLLAEILAAGKWERVAAADATVVIRRV